MFSIRKAFKKKKQRGEESKKNEDNSSTSAQHNLLCDNCEQEPAQFHCKSCPGHLCGNCKSDHGMKKLTKSHDIVSLTSKNQDMMDLLYCTDHSKRKVECYCINCGEPVCTECILQSHNGHEMSSLSIVLSTTRRKIQIKKDDIEKKLLPKYEEELAILKSKRESVAKNADDIQKKIDQQTNKLIRVAQITGKNHTEQLNKEKEQAFQKIDGSIAKFNGEIQRLHRYNDSLSNHLDSDPSSLITSCMDIDDLESLEPLPRPPNPNLTEFRPGDAAKCIEVHFRENQAVQQAYPFEYFQNQESPRQAMEYRGTILQTFGRHY